MREGGFVCEGTDPTGSSKDSDRLRVAEEAVHWVRGHVGTLALAVTFVQTPIYADNYQCMCLCVFLCVSVCDRSAVGVALISGW